MILTRALLIALPVVGLMGFAAGWVWRGDRAEGNEARQQASASAAQVAQVNGARATEHAQAEALATIGANHEEDRTAAATVPDGSPMEHRDHADQQAGEPYNPLS